MSVDGLEAKLYSLIHSKGRPMNHKDDRGTSDKENQVQHYMNEISVEDLWNEKE